MRPLGFKTRLWLGHVAVLAVMLALAAFGADWALRRAVLGLAIARALVERQGGRISVETAEKGATFSVHLRRA
jgi:hypothetical protein